MKLRVLIADDEPLARERVRCFLQTERAVEIVAEAANGSATLEGILKHRPDLVFLDVQMPHLNGFEVLAALAPEEVPAVIFVTAHDEHAIKAFEVNALDYLLKPYSEERFIKALEKARDHLRLQASGPHPDPRLSQLLKQVQAASPCERIVVRSPGRILFLKPGEIDHVEAAGNYAILHLAKDRHVIRETMASMEARLGKSGFLRISRSSIVNLRGVQEVKPSTAGQFTLLLKSGARLDMTCSLRELERRLSEI
jgi:two-component system LytT family response regulator